MRGLPVIVRLALAISAPLAQSRASQELHAQGVVAGYLPEYRWYVDVESAVACCLTDLILFSVQPLASGTLDAHWINPANFARARAAADAVPGRVVNVLLSVGGAGRSGGFAAACASKGGRRKLVKSLVALLDAHALDGLDFDWEVRPGNYFKTADGFRFY